MNQCIIILVIKMIINIKDVLKEDLSDKVLVFQTDTVYGIGTPVNNLDGVKRIYSIKKREAKKPLPVLCANIEQVKSIVKNYDEGAFLSEKYWPGPLTLVYLKNDIIHDDLTSGFNTVGVRIPNDELVLSILKKTGPMAVTSLNLSSEPAVLKFEDTIKFLNEVDFIVEGSDLNNISSTVYDVENENVLRQGTIKI